MEEKIKDPAEEILKKYFPGCIGKNFVYITDKKVLLEAMNEYVSKKIEENGEKSNNT